MLELGIPTEHEEQAAFVAWAAWHGATAEPALLLLFAIPNGGKRSIKTARALRVEGVRAGVPDLFLPCARGGAHGLFIEMKRSRGGSLSAAQREVIEKLRAQGYRVAVCAGAQQAQEQVLEYLRGK
jgi:hypothetical protein